MRRWTQATHRIHLCDTCHGQITPGTRYLAETVPTSTGLRVERVCSSCVEEANGTADRRRRAREVADWNEYVDGGAYEADHHGPSYQGLY